MTRTFRVAAAAMALMTAVALPGAAATQAAQPVTLQAFSGTWEGAAQTPNGEVALRAAFNELTEIYHAADAHPAVRPHVIP